MNKLSRRLFLENSMFAATATALATLRAKNTPAQEPPKAKGPNERINVAVVGVRGQGGGHLQAYTSRLDTLVTYIVDVDREVGMKRVKEVEDRQGLAPKYVTDLREMLDDPRVDVVSTATPNHWHSLVSIWSMQAGKDVYVEKPVSHNVSEGRRMVEVARKYGRICQTGTQCRSMPGTMQAIEFIRAGKIGEVKVARGLCYKPRGSIGAMGMYSPPASVDYNLWLGPAPNVPLTRPNLHYDWHWMWDFGNGDLGNQGIHQMDIARWGLGVNQLSNAVTSFGGRVGYEDAGETPNTQVIFHEYGDKSLIFEVRGLPTADLKGAKIGVIFEGTSGYVVLTSYDGGAAFDTAGNMIATFQGSGDHFGNFLGACRSRKVEELHADIQEGHLSSALCHTGNISFRLGASTSAADLQSQFATNDVQRETFARFREHLAANQIPLESAALRIGPRLTFDPASERFVDNFQANAWLTREYRAPFVVPTAAQI